MAALREENVGSGLHFEAVHQMTAYRQEGRTLPETEGVCARILSLPLFPGMTDGDTDDVIDAVRRIAGSRAR